MFTKKRKLTASISLIGSNNLYDIERENKMIQSNLHHEKLKEQHEEKSRRKVEEKEELVHKLAIDREPVNFVYLK